MSYGGAIFSRGDVTLVNVNIVGNNAGNGEGGGGGGIYTVCGSGMLTVRDSMFKDNTALHGGAILSHHHAGITDVRNSIFIDNSAISGGGVYAPLGEVWISNSEISSNVATVRGGGVFRVAGEVTSTESAVLANTAPTDPDEGGYN